MSHSKITNPASGGEDSNHRTEGRIELSRRGLLATDRDCASPGESEGFIREVRVPRRARGRDASWPVDRTT
jgi:hypothetical protein